MSKLFKAKQLKEKKAFFLLKNLLKQKAGYATSVELTLKLDDAVEF